MNKLKLSLTTGRMYVKKTAKKDKMKYSHINLERTLIVRGHEYLYFTTWQEGTVYEWQRGSHTINVKARAAYESPDLECFSMSYDKKRPGMRDAKCCILDYINER